MKILKITVTALLLISSHAASAIPLAQENFDYANGALTGQSGGSGFANAWSGSGQVVNGMGVFDASTFDLAFRNLSNPLAPQAGDSLFMAFDFGVSSSATSAFGGAALCASDCISGSGAVQEVVFAGVTFPAADLGLAANGFATPDSGLDPAAFPSLDRVVTELLFGAGGNFTANLYVNPGGTLGAPDNSVDGSYAGGFIDLLRLGGGMFDQNQPAMTVFMDNLWLGTTYQDVILDVSEPGILSILGISLAALVVSRRRKKLID